MRHVRPGLAVACSVALAGLSAAACGGGAESEAEPSVPPPPAQTNNELPRGGTLQVGLVDWAAHEEAYTSPDGQAHYALDPQFEYYGPAFELFRCCLLRTLLSYNGTPTAEGGAEPRPDLAAELPTVSSDGLTWTFHLKPGLHYAPPYEDVEITSPDVVRGIERMFNPPNASMAEAFGRLTIGGYESYYQPLIEGTEAFASGTADSISGLETPDDYTLVVHLTEPTGDLAERFTLPQRRRFRRAGRTATTTASGLPSSPPAPTWCRAICQAASSCWLETHPGINPLTSSGPRTPTASCLRSGSVRTAPIDR